MKAHTLAFLLLASGVMGCKPTTTPVAKQHALAKKPELPPIQVEAKAMVIENLEAKMSAPGVRLSNMEGRSAFFTVGHWFQKDFVGHYKIHDESGIYPLVATMYLGGDVVILAPGKPGTDAPLTSGSAPIQPLGDEGTMNAVGDVQGIDPIVVKSLDGKRSGQCFGQARFVVGVVGTNEERQFFMCDIVPPSKPGDSGTPFRSSDDNLLLLSGTTEQGFNYQQKNGAETKTKSTSFLVYLANLRHPLPEMPHK
ncbi:MAG: hypothetical protein WC045_00925 [Patescibacteria group bacterium]